MKKNISKHKPHNGLMPTFVTYSGVALLFTRKKDNYVVKFL